MERWSSKTAVVAGASAGIGAAISVALANAGLNVVGLARRPNLVDELKSSVTGTGSIHGRKCDVSKVDDLKECFRWTEDKFGGVDILINNAAVFVNGHITEVGPDPMSEELISQMLDVNIKAAIIGTRLAVASMKKRGVAGHIININSIAGHYIPFASGFNVYPASKHAITALTGSLAVELAEFKTNIKTTSISPGLVKTDMSQAINTQFVSLDPKDIAGAVMYVVSTPAHVNISELTIQPVGEKRM